MARPRKRTVALLLLAGFAAFVYLNNASWIGGAQAEGPPELLAHRGLAQDFAREGLDNETCTAERMLPSGHAYLENTIPSMRAAFRLGADVVEFDVHRTTDDRFAVFHDWTVDCRTEGTGRTIDHALDSLQRLDVGFGYTPDGGRTYPFRGQGVGLVPSLQDVLATFPERRFLVNLKSQEPSDGALLADRLQALPAAQQARLMVYGGGGAVGVIRERLPHIPTMWPARLRTCLKRYAALGWSGHVPAACERALVMVPANYAPWLWGWPHRFVQRMEAAGSAVFVVGDHEGQAYSTGLDDPARLAEIPEGFGGGVWTDRIDRLGPALARGE